MKKLLLPLMLVLFMGTQLKAQVVTVKERKSNDEQIVVTKPYFVDINSTLTLEINKDSLLLEMAEVIGAQTYPKALMQVVNATLRKQQEIINAITAKGDRKERLDALKTFRTSMSPLLMLLAQNQDSLQGTPLYDAVNNALSTASPDYGPVFTALNEQYKAVTAEYTQKVNQSSARFKLAGWLNTSSGSRQFHIHGFDSLAEGGIVTIPRFVTSIPPAEAQAYNEARNLADSININIEGFLTSVKEGVQNQISDVENKVTVIIQGAYTSMENDIQSLASGVESKFTGPVSTLKQDLNDFKTEVVKFVEMCKVQSSTPTVWLRWQETLPISMTRQRPLRPWEILSGPFLSPKYKVYLLLLTN